jgi:hypothetical protein
MYAKAKKYIFVWSFVNSEFLFGFGRVDVFPELDASWTSCAQRFGKTQCLILTFASLFFLEWI